MRFSRGSSWPRDQTEVFCIAGRFFTIWVNVNKKVNIKTNLHLMKEDSLQKFFILISLLYSKTLYLLQLRGTCVSLYLAPWLTLSLTLGSRMWQNGVPTHNSTSRDLAHFCSLLEPCYTTWASMLNDERTVAQSPPSPRSRKKTKFKTVSPS